MKCKFAVTIVFLGAACPYARGQDLEFWFMERLAMRNAATMRYSEFFIQRGKTILADLVYIDFGKSNYREVTIGGGRVLVSNKYFDLTHEESFCQASGSASHNARYIFPWWKAGYRITPRIGGNLVYFMHLPLNKAGAYHQALDRVKLEYDFGRWKFGGGYGGSRPAGKGWQSKPMAIATLKCGKFGNLEFWVQRLPGNHVQAQIRYAGMFKRER